EGGDAQVEHDRGEHHRLRQRIAHLLRWGGADQRWAAGGAPGDQEQHVDAVADQRHAHDHAGQTAFQQQVNTGGHQHADHAHQGQRGAHLDTHAPPPGPVPAPPGALPPYPPPLCLPAPPLLPEPVPIPAPASISGSASSAVLRGESCATSGAACPAASPWRSTPEPRERSTSSTRPTTTRNTPMSKNREVTRCTSPNTGSTASICTDCSTTPPKNRGTAPTPAERNRPEPSSTPGRIGAASPSS